MRPIWSGVITFVLVNIPVRLYTAIESRGVSFNLLHEKDLSRIRYQRICEMESKEVPYEELVRGYEYQKDEYVVITDEDLEKADPKKSKSIEIVDFADEKEIDSIYFGHPYFLEPDEGAEKSFALLRDALTKAGKIGIAKFILRDREHLAVIKPLENGILLQQLHFAHEIRSEQTLKLPSEKANPKELELALALIEKLSSQFDIQEFKDEYHEILMKIIEQKAKGKLVRPFSTEPSPTEFADLMTKLKQSLEESPAKK